MAVSFVNAGLLTFCTVDRCDHGCPTIGTTITAWLVALFRFKSKLPYKDLLVNYRVFFCLFGFSRNNRLRNIAQSWSFWYLVLSP